MIKITLEYDNPDDAILALAALRDKGAAGGPPVPGNKKIKVTGTPPEKAGEVQPDPKPGKSVSTEAAAAAPSTATPGTAQSQPAASVKSDSENSASSTAVEYPTVAAAITAAVGIDKPKVIAVLGTFKAKSGKDLQPEQYQKFLDALAKAMAPEGDDLS